MWIYSQKSGKLWWNSTLIGTGYAGHGIGKNNPEKQDQKNVGPLPCGFYIFGMPFDSESHGPYVIPLTPDPANEMHGRSGFLCHGERREGPPGEASLGCMIMQRPIREAIPRSGDSLLKVIADDADRPPTKSKPPTP